MRGPSDYQEKGKDTFTRFRHRKNIEMGPYINPIVAKKAIKNRFNPRIVVGKKDFGW